MDTVPVTLPPAPSPLMVPTRPSRRHRWWAIPLVVAAAVPPAAIVVRSTLTVDKFAITPGDAAPSEARLKVPANKAHQGKGEILFVTVGVPRLTQLALDIAKNEKDVDVVPAKSILGSSTPEQNRQENLQLMRYSKDYAAYVALRKLGYPVKVSDGGAAISQFACIAESADGKSCVTFAPASTVLKEHDVITAIDGKPINVTTDISEAIKGKNPGDSVQVTYRRGKDEHVDAVTLTRSSDGRTLIGILPDPSPPNTVHFTFPFDVTIDSGQVGGPSAGLAFTLALLDKLTPGELANGVPVAATGEMSPGGIVGDIGGLRQKTIAVMRTNAKVFLVPDDQKAEAENEVKAKHGSLKIVGVVTIDDALKALADLGGNATQLGTPGASS